MITVARKREMGQMLEEALNNPEFEEKMMKVESEDELVVLLNDTGMVISKEEVHDALAEAPEVLSKLVNAETGELTEAGMDLVAGGGKTGRMVVACIGGAIVGGTMGFLTYGSAGLLTPATAKIALGYSVVAAAWVQAG